MTGSGPDVIRGEERRETFRDHRCVSEAPARCVRGVSAPLDPAGLLARRVSRCKGTTCVAMQGHTQLPENEQRRQHSWGKVGVEKTSPPRLCVGGAAEQQRAAQQRSSRGGAPTRFSCAPHSHFLPLHRKQPSLDSAFFADISSHTELSDSSRTAAEQKQEGGSFSPSPLFLAQQQRPAAMSTISKKRKVSLMSSARAGQ